MKKQVDLFSGLASRIPELTFDCNLPELAILYLDGNGKVLQYSDHFNEWIKKPEVLVGSNLLDVKGNEWLSKRILEEGRCKGKVCEGILHFEGSREKFEVSLFCIHLGGTRNIPAAFIFFIRKNDDIGERAPNNWLHYEKLRIIVENAGDAISLHSLSGEFIYISPSVEKLHGYSSAELMSQGALLAVHPDDKGIIINALEKLSNNHESVKTQYRFIHKKGHIIWVESISQSISNEKGEPSMISIITRDITASRLLQDSLKRNEEKYRTLVKYLPTGVLLMNTQGEILEVNQALLDMLGSPGDEPTRIINMFEFENLVVAGISANLKKCIDEKKIVNGQTEYMSKWGKKSFLLYSAVPVVDNVGEVTQVICNVRDITRIKKAEEKSQQQIDFQNIVINTMQEPFFVKDENHKWIMLNDAAVEMMGQPRDALLGKSDYELYPKVQADIFWEKDAFVLENGSNVNEEKIIWSDGSERSIITYKRLYTERSTGKRYIVGTIHDITELKETETKLRESERKYHDLFENANDFIFTTDLNGVFTNANKAMLGRMNITLKELGNYNIFSYCKPEILEEVRTITSELLKTGNVASFEIETPEINGNSVILEIRARLMYQNDIPIGIQGIARDVSEKKIASQKLEQVNRELQEMNASKDKFYTIIAHDLKNPFNSLIGFSELLLEEFDELTKYEMRDYVGIIRNTAKNSLILLENLLAWSRLQTGRMVYNPIKLNLANEVDATTNVLYSLSYRKKILVENNIDRNVIVKADQNMLLSIMHNLVMNAIKFTPLNGTISIHCICKEGNEKDGKENFAEISITDTGIGISKEDQKKLFSLTKPFTMPGTDKESGTGLGLLLTREMIEKHGGVLMIESELGKGSTFSFRLPLFVP